MLNEFEKNLKAELTKLRDTISNDYYASKDKEFDWKNVADILHDTLIVFISYLEAKEE